MSNKIREILKNIPLDVRVKVGIQTEIVHKHGGSFFVPLDENGGEHPDVVEANNKCFAIAEPVVKSALEIIKEWKEDKSIPLEKRIETFDKKIQDIILDEVKEWEDDGCP